MLPVRPRCCPIGDSPHRGVDARLCLPYSVQRQRGALPRGFLGGNIMTISKAFFAAIAAATIIVSAPAASADGLLASRLGAILGQERQALSVVPDSRMATLTTLPPANERGIETASGVVYDNTYLAALPAVEGGTQWECLAEALYFEARGETVRGMFAVGEVILNRVDSGAYPDTLCRVINQGTGRKFACQFTYTCDGRAEVIAEPRAWERVGKVAGLLLDGTPRALTGGATHYHTKAVNPSWAQRFPRTASIGSHYFYRQPVRTASK
jgi:hypothetical protein